MTVYADYAYYAENSLKRIPEGEYPFYARKAAAVMDFFTFGRLKTFTLVTEPVKACACEIAELFYERFNATGQNPNAPAPVKSETVDGYSVSYNLSDASAKTDGCVFEPSAPVRAVCEKYLTFPVNLLCAGVK